MIAQLSVKKKRMIAQLRQIGGVFFLLANWRGVNSTQYSHNRNEAQFPLKYFDQQV